MTAHHEDDQIETIYMAEKNNSSWVSKIGIRSNLTLYNDNENKVEFRIPKRLSFNHIFFSKESRSLEEVRQYLVNKNKKSDPFLLGRNFSDKTIRQIQRDFGDKFAASLDELTTLKNDLVIESIYGWHIVNVSNIEDSYLPEFNFIKDKLLDTYLLVKKDEVLKKYTEDLIKSYDVSLSKKYSFE